MARLGQWDEFAAYDTPITTALVPPDTVADGASGDWYTALPEIIGAVTAWDQARQLYKLNLERVSQGQEPIAAQTVQPGVTATVGISEDVKQLAFVALAVVAGLFIFKALR